MLKKVFYFSLTFVVLVNIFVLIFNKSEAQNTYCTPVPSLIWGSSTWPGAGRLVMTSSTQGVLIEYSGAPIVTGSGSINKIAFWTGSNTLSSDTNLHWDNVNKRLGINTTSPSYELDVNGTIRANQIIGTYTGTINAANVSAGQFGANTGGGDYYFMGNVGIGTTAPGSKLHVHGSGFPVFISSSAGAGGTPGIEMQDPTAANYGARVYFDDAAAGGIGGLKLVGLSNGVETLGIFINRDSGNVGIGTTTPRGKLEVNGSIYTAGMISFTGGYSASCPDCWITSNYGGGEGLYINSPVNNITVMRFGGPGYKIYFKHNTSNAYIWTPTGSVYLNQSGDIAELYPFKSPRPEEGEIVVISSDSDGYIEKSNSPYAFNMIGVVSTKPAVVIGNKTTSIEELKIKTPIALVGRVPIKVIVFGGNYIKRGDPITSSFLPGIGMKATKAGKIVGMALESTEYWNEQKCPVVSALEVIQWSEDDGTNFQKQCFRVPVSSLESEVRENIKKEYNLSDSDYLYVGKIMFFVNVSWYEP